MLDGLITYLRRHHIALLALFVALGGSAYAASKVGTRNLKDESIRSVDVRDGAIRGRDIKPDSIGAKQLATDPYIVSSGSVFGLGGTDVQLLDPDGFTQVQRTGVGTYVLTFSDETPVCNSALSPIEPIGAKNPPVSISVAGTDGQTLTIETADENGDLADLGTDLGYVGFSILGTC